MIIINRFCSWELATNRSLLLSRGSQFQYYHCFVRWLVNTINPVSISCRCEHKRVLGVCWILFEIVGYESQSFGNLFEYNRFDFALLNLDIVRPVLQNVSGRQHAIAMPSLLYVIFSNLNLNFTDSNAHLSIYSSRICQTNIQTLLLNDFE